MADTATSKPFMIQLPSGAKLYGITVIDYIKDGNIVKAADPNKGSNIIYYTQVNRNDWVGTDNGGITYAAPGTGTPKFYNIQGAYNRLGNGKWEPSIYAGAELKQEFAKYDQGKPTQISTVVATAPQAVATATGTSSSGLAQKLLKPKTAASAPTVAPQPQPDVPDNTGGITKEEIDAAGADVVNINIPSKNKQESGYMGVHVYPSDMRKTNQDRIKFTLYESLGADISANPTQIFQPNFSGRVISQRRSTVPLGEVYLPIQPSITDSNNVEWSGASLNAFEAAAFSKSVGLMGQPNVASAAGDIYNSVKEAMKGLASQDNSIAQSLKVFLAQEAVGIQGMLSRTTGSVLNPNLELLFNGPSLRPFNFTFRLSPRDKPEADEVRRIIRFFKKGMSVRNASSNVFLKSPNVFDIQYQVGGDNSPHKSLPRIKRCALLSCDVDYTPDGTYMTYDDEAKTLTSYQISLRFSELEPIYDSDYKDTEEQIGY